MPGYAAPRTIEGDDRATWELYRGSKPDGLNHVCNMFVCVRLQKRTILFAAYLVGSQTSETTQKNAPGYADAFAGSSKPGVPEAALGHGRSW